LIEDSQGDLFGVTANGGPGSSIGTIYELPAGSDTIVTLASFTGANGGSPQAGLLMDAAGDLFGTCFNGGADDDGTVFELPAGSSTILTLATFDGGNGEFPYSSLVADSAGDLYGTTLDGGTDNDGEIFKITDSGFVLAVPEPSSVALLAATSALALRRRRKSPPGNARINA
jgi:uncharacterized repeat protein (TIGR03803 family)